MRVCRLTVSDRLLCGFGPLGEFLVLGGEFLLFGSERVDLLLQFVFDVTHAWVVWPSLALTLTLPRMILKYSDEDEELYDELQETEQETRKERLRRAAERVHELEPREDSQEDDR